MPCSRCGAPVGKLCIVNPKTLAANPGRPIMHTERRKAYQTWRDQQAKEPSKRIPIGGVAFAVPVDKTVNSAGWRHTNYMGDERSMLLQLVRDGKPLPNRLFLIGQVPGGYERITAEDINWETSNAEFVIGSGSDADRAQHFIENMRQP